MSIFTPDCISDAYNSALRWLLPIPFPSVEDENEASPTLAEILADLDPPGR